jgi:hypothetical protein
VVTGATGARDAAAQAPAAQRFEAAKTASAQRAATNMAAVDSLSGLRDDARIRRLGNVTFVLRDSVWTDVRFKKEMTTLRVQPFSAAYFRLIEALPELRETFAFSERLIIAGRSMAIELSPAGKERLSDSDLALVRERW